MKIKVDKMPSTVYDCPFVSRLENYWGHPVYKCGFGHEEHSCFLVSEQKCCPHFICDEPEEETLCNHEWIGYGITTITHQAHTVPVGSYEYCICEKCGEHNLKPIQTDENGCIVRRY